MKYLLDTHTFLWFIAGDEVLPLTIRKLIQEPTTARLLSNLSCYLANFRDVAEVRWGVSHNNLVL